MKDWPIDKRDLVGVYRGSVIWKDRAGDKDGFGQGLKGFLHGDLDFAIINDGKNRGSETSVTVTKLMVSQKLEYDLIGQGGIIPVNLSTRLTGNHKNSQEIFV